MTLPKGSTPMIRSLYVKLLLSAMLIVALLMIVINGLLYITANGDAQKTVQARLGVLYSAIGLIVVIFAAAIVTFVAKGL